MKVMLKIALLLAVVALPGVASATILGTVTGSADCDGFTAEGAILWGSSPTADLTWTAVLTDEGGAEVASLNGGATFTRFTNPYTVSGSWGVELCGTYTAVFSAHMHAVSADGLRISDSDASFTVTFTCDCPQDACNFTPGYWKNHPENWPVMELMLGDVTYNQEELLVILNMPVEGDATIILAHHLIAAKLNVLSGSDPSINGAIDDADDLLVTYPLYSYPTRGAKGEVLGVKDLLAAYNELGCGEDDMDLGDGMDSLLLEKTLPDETSSTWGQLKANYR